jgi:hypothetical protein
MIGKFTMLVVVYGGLSVAALLLLVIGTAIARTRAEVIGVAVICGTLVALNAAELVYLGSLGSMWIGEGVDPLLVAGAALVLVAGTATALFLRRGRRVAGFSRGMR